MTELLELTENLEVSRPVFRLQLNGNKSRIDANTHSPVYRYRPQRKPNCVLSELIVQYYSEQFSPKTGEFTIDKHDIAKSAMDKIRSNIEKYVEANLDMKAPRQSKLYRWIDRDMPSSSEFNDVLVMVYKYMRSHSNSDMKSFNKDHINNTIALLQAIMEKHSGR